MFEVRPLRVGTKVALWRVGDGVGFFVDEDVEVGKCLVEVPARALFGCMGEELIKGNAITLADVPTGRPPASGWAVFHQEGFVAFFLQDPPHIFPWEVSLFPGRPLLHPPSVADTQPTPVAHPCQALGGR